MRFSRLDRIPMLGRPLILLLICSVRSVAASSQQSSSCPVPLHPDRPAFLKVDEKALQRAWEIAVQRHEAAVQKALEHYPLDDASTPDSSLPRTRVAVDSRRVDSTNRVPDYATELAPQVHVTTHPLLSNQECSKVLKAAKGHFVPMPSGPYTVSGLWIKDVPAVKEWFLQQLRQKLLPVLVQLYPDFLCAEDDLCVDNAYLFEYTVETGRRTAIHTDSGCLSLTIALNDDGDYTGGGTWFEGLASHDKNDPDTPVAQEQQQHAQTVHMKKGQVMFRPGGLKHAGQAVLSGTRYIIGGFCMHRKKVEPVRQWLSPPLNYDKDEQVACLEAALAVNPTCDAMYSALAVAYQEKGALQEARQVLEEGLKRHPASADTAFSMAGLYIQLYNLQQDNKEKDYLHKALACYDTCLRVDPDDVDAWVGVGQAAALLGLEDREREAQLRVVSIPGAPARAVATAFCNLGVLAEGTDQEAEYYRQSIQAQPTNFSPWYSLGSAYAARKDYEQAMDAFRQALMLVDDSDDRGFQARQALYKSAAFYMKESCPELQGADTTTILQKYKELMGGDHFEKLQQAARNRS